MANRANGRLRSASASVLAGLSAARRIDLLPAGSVFAFLAEHRRRLFPDAMFEDLFPSGRGRPSVPPEVMASVIVLQTLHGLSDREAAER